LDYNQRRVMNFLLREAHALLANQVQPPEDLFVALASLAAAMMGHDDGETSRQVRALRRDPSLGREDLDTFS
jgi:hypothetical protein